MQSTERWFVANKQGWITLRHDLGLAYNAGVKLAPIMSDIANAFVGAISPIQNVIDALLGVGKGLDTGFKASNGFAEWIGARMHLNYDGKPLVRETPVMITQHFHGPAHGPTVAAAARSAIERAGKHGANRSGHIVTSAQTATALSVPR